MNGFEGNFFATGKRLRQGDPLSPLLVNLVVDTLTKMLFKAFYVWLLPSFLFFSFLLFLCWPFGLCNFCHLGVSSSYENDTHLPLRCGFKK